MQSPRHILTIAMVSAILLQCGSKGSKADASATTQKTPTDKLVADLKAEYGMFTRTFYDSLIGDMFLKDTTEKIYWLDVGRGKITLVANEPDEFKNKLQNIEQVNEWFMIDLTTELMCSDKKLKEGQLYSYKRLPILGGDYSVDNFEPTDIEVHFCFAGQIHEQVKDLPDGTRIDKITFVD